MNNSFVSFVFWAYVTIGGHCEYQQVAFAMNNHDQVLVMTDGMKVHLKTIEPFLEYKFMEDLIQEDSSKKVFYGFRFIHHKDSEFTFEFKKKEYIGDLNKRYRRHFFSERNTFTISSKPCIILGSGKVDVGL